MKKSTYLGIAMTTCFLGGFGVMGKIGYDHFQTKKINQIACVQKYDGLQEAVLGLDKAIDAEIEVSVRNDLIKQQKDLERDLQAMEKNSYLQENLSERESRSSNFPIYLGVGLYMLGFVFDSFQRLAKAKELVPWKKSSF